MSARPDQRAGPAGSTPNARATIGPDAVGADDDTGLEPLAIRERHAPSRHARRRHPRAGRPRPASGARSSSAGSSCDRSNPTAGAASRSSSPYVSRNLVPEAVSTRIAGIGLATRAMRTFVQPGAPQGRHRGRRREDAAGAPAIARRPLDEHDRVDRVARAWRRSGHRRVRRRRRPHRRARRSSRNRGDRDPVAEQPADLGLDPEPSLVDQRPQLGSRVRPSRGQRCVVARQSVAGGQPAEQPRTEHSRSGPEPGR